MTMRVSISVTDYSRLDTLDDIAAAADAAGVDTLWVPDHLLQAAPGSDPGGPMLEAYTALGYLAARTARVRLGTLVTAVTYRPFAIVAKAVETLQLLSGGRAWLGIGAGYHEEEARRFGVPLPALRERFDALEAALRGFGGAPVLVGGMGEKRTLPLVARYADACNLFDIPDGGKTVGHKREVLRRLCAQTGREVEVTLSTRIAPGETPDAFAERMGGLGIEHAVLVPIGPWDPDEVARLGDYIRNTP
jgi:alkanesulfonate monooxygenase SsuD/methylene tetrahydromethanopterin reductase-like flavin-dependent oxidoreductase (luciferase family)